MIGNDTEHVEQEVAQTVYFLLDSSQFDVNELFIKPPLAFFICNLPWNFQIASLLWQKAPGDLPSTLFF